MKLLQTAFNDKFRQTVKEWVDEIHKNKSLALIHVYVSYQLEDRNEKLICIRKILDREAYGILVVGCSATGEILNGSMVDNECVITATIFDDPSTNIRVMPYYLKNNKSDDKLFLENIKSIPNLKGIEVLTCADSKPMTEFGNLIDTIPHDIDIFGGVAVGDDKNQAFVFANDDELSYNATIFICYSGSNLHIQTNRIFGWNAIGYPLKVTKSKGLIVYELNNKPAYDVYNHYLQIEKGDNFFYDALEFPWEIQVDDKTSYIRHAKQVNPDGSLVMSSPIPEGSYIRLSYGDPRRMIKHSKQVGFYVKEFVPQVVKIINCMGRKLFWGENDSLEIKEICNPMKMTGFSALGEIMRFNGNTFLNNLSIVTVAIREGEGKTQFKENDNVSALDTNIPITARLAIFINTITEELIDKNKQLNEMLYKASHDALTNLYNRGAIEREIYDNVDNEGYLIMLDIDDFKLINDRYGHTEGDRYLRMVADILKKTSDKYCDVAVGRWGGEEFMIFIKNVDLVIAKEFAESIRMNVYSDVRNDKDITVSIGVAKHNPRENISKTINRVDEYLYEAKNSGKNRICGD